MLKTPKQKSRVALAALFLLAGCMHFLSPEKFLMIMPPQIPWPYVCIYVSGFFELLGGIGLLLPRFQRKAGLGLALLLILVWPANIYMAVQSIPMGPVFSNPIVQWVRVPFQLVLIGWVLWCSSDEG